MLRKRLITVLTFNNGVLFRTKLFQPDYRYTLNFVDAWSIDEIVVLDVTRNASADRNLFFSVVRGLARRCFVPVTVGGGIRSVDDVGKYLDAGADKVTINTGALHRPELITDIAKLYGTQCVVLSMDAKREADGAFQVYGAFGSAPSGRTPSQWARQGAQLGAGEIMVNSIDRDGSLSGYDIPLCRSVTEVVSIPVLMCGGAGNWGHFVEGLREGGADAACTSNIYHFTESSIKNAKAYLRNAGLLVRLG